MLRIDTPVTESSSIDEIRDWIVELADLRATYRHDVEALRVIASEEQYVHHLLDAHPQAAESRAAARHLDALRPPGP